MTDFHDGFGAYLRWSIAAAPRSRQQLCRYHATTNNAAPRPNYIEGQLTPSDLASGLSCVTFGYPGDLDVIRKKVDEGSQGESRL